MFACFPSPMSKQLKLNVVLACAVAVVLGWAYWPTLGEIANLWATHSIYSHGYLVPVFAGFLLYRRRDLIRGQAPKASWWGVPLVFVGVVMHVVGAYYYVDWFSAASILPLLAG